MLRPTVILHGDTPDEAIAFVAEDHPGLTLQGCDSYAALPALIAASGAEVVYSVRFAGTRGDPSDAVLSPPVRPWRGA